jgi:hypothetical protein
LTPGQAIVAGDAMNTPVLIKVRERYTTHGAESQNATTQWRAEWTAKSRESSGVKDPYEDDEEVNTDPL